MSRLLYILFFVVITAGCSDDQVSVNPGVPHVINPLFAGFDGTQWKGYSQWHDDSAFVTMDVYEETTERCRVHIEFTGNTTPYLHKVDGSILQDSTVVWSTSPYDSGLSTGGISVMFSGKYDGTIRGNLSLRRDGQVFYATNYEFTMQ